jgi:hypothetical protein
MFTEYICHKNRKTAHVKGSVFARRTTTVLRFRAEEPPFSQIAKVIGGRAIVSIHMRPVSTPSLRSVGHSPHVHGTQAQIYLATSPYLNVVSNACRKGKKAGRAKTLKAKMKLNG